MKYDIFIDFHIEYLKNYARFVVTVFNLHFINQNEFQYVSDPLLHTSQTA